MRDDGRASIDVMTVGEVLVDLVAPDAPDLADASTFMRAAGGAPANVAVAAARLGARTALVSAVGRDPFGRYLRQVLQENGVDVSAVIETDEPTSLAFVARNTGGIPDFVFYRGADAALRAEHVPVAAIAGARFAHVSSMALLSEHSRGATLRAVEVARGAGTLVSLDPNLRPTSWPTVDAARDAMAPLLDAADILKVNDDEARLLTGSSDLGAALTMLGRPGRLTVITLGAAGCVWRWRMADGHVAAPAVEVVETTGAGDAFAGALLAELSRRGIDRDTFPSISGQEFQEVVEVAVAAGALACTQVGAMTALPTRADIETLLQAG
jgi:fructokinase